MNATKKMIWDKKAIVIAVQIPIGKYKKMPAQPEEWDDIRIFDNAMKRIQEFVPFIDVVKGLKPTEKIMYQLSLKDILKNVSFLL